LPSGNLSQLVIIYLDLSVIADTCPQTLCNSSYQICFFIFGI
jgi:hypothetical protein